MSLSSNHNNGMTKADRMLVDINDLASMKNFVAKCDMLCVNPVNKVIELYCEELMRRYRAVPEGIYNKLNTMLDEQSNLSRHISERYIETNVLELTENSLRSILVNKKIEIGTFETLSKGILNNNKLWRPELVLNLLTEIKFDFDGFSVVITPLAIGIDYGTRDIYKLSRTIADVADILCSTLVVLLICETLSIAAKNSYNETDACVQCIRSLRVRGIDVRKMPREMMRVKTPKYDVDVETCLIVSSDGLYNVDSNLWHCVCNIGKVIHDKGMHSDIVNALANIHCKYRLPRLDKTADEIADSLEAKIAFTIEEVSEHGC